MWGGAVVLFVGASAFAQELAEPAEPAALEAVAAHEEALGLERVYEGATEWTYLMPPDTPDSELRVRSVPAQTWVEGFVSMAIHTNQALPPNAPPIVCGAHNSVAVNVCMPTTATSGLAAADAGGTNLFEAYVRAFCELDQP